MQGLWKIPSIWGSRMNNLKKCPKCERWSVSFDHNLGIEYCHWIDCHWSNRERIPLPIAHKTILTSRRVRDVK